jgi:hypothetical protein
VSSDLPTQEIFWGALRHPLLSVAQWWPDWIQELAKWEVMQEAEWHFVSRSKPSYVDMAKRKPQQLIRNQGDYVFRRTSYLDNYCQHNFAPEFVPMDHQKD